MNGMHATEIMKVNDIYMSQAYRHVKDKVELAQNVLLKPYGLHQFPV